MVRRVLLAALMAGLLSSCAAGPALFLPSTGRVTGHVTYRVCGGAYLEDQPACRTSPAAGAQIVFRLNGASASSTATTDSAGAYAIDLEPGTYTVASGARGSSSLSSAAVQALAPRGFAGPTTITVVAGKTVTADFVYTIQLL